MMDENRLTIWIVYGRYGTELIRPEIHTSEKDAHEYIRNEIANAVMSDFREKLLNDGVNLMSAEDILMWGEENDYCTENTYMGGSDWLELQATQVNFRIDVREEKTA